MAAKYYTILTEVGKTKVANAAALGRQIKLTQMAVGDGDGSEYDPVESQTSLKQETYRTPISHLGTDAQNPNWVIAEGMIPVDVGGWFVREVGLFDEDGDLFAIGKYPETYKPTLAEGTGRDLYIRFIMVVSNTESIDLKIDPTVAIATKEWVEINFLHQDLLQVSPSDAAENKIMVNGAHGLGGNAIFLSGDSFDLDNPTIPTGFYTVSSGHLGTYPPGHDGSDPAVLSVVLRYPGTMQLQTYRTKAGVSFEREYSSSSWSEWRSANKSFGSIVLNGLKPGRHVHIYKWGSRTGGEDWCFIRTPDNYDPNGKSHEFVVLNHGNGWTMDGTEEKANFSSKTQFGVDDQNGGTYLDTNRSDYVEYSSPLIEALLAEGFVVCGAQNDNGMPANSAAGWGARQVRQNIRDFVDHMRKNYNVTQYCHMIGASNGGLATLNAAMIMGRHNIRSITLLYPVTNLYSAWKYSHRSSVEAAYGITADSFPDFTEKTEGHDPMSAFNVFTPQAALNKDELLYADVSEYIVMPKAGQLVDWVYRRDLIGNYPSTGESIVDGGAHSRIVFARASMFPWPRIRCHYSMEDTLLDMNKHWLSFKRVLINGGHVIYDQQVTGNHGSWEHFDNVSGIIGWMKL